MNLIKLITQRFLIIISILIVMIFILLIINYFQENDISYQLNKLRIGNPDEKIKAVYFLGENKIVQAIPLFINNVRSEEFSFAKSKAPWYVSCLATQYLGEITGVDIGDSCNSDNSKKAAEIEAVQIKWETWYKNDYPYWLYEYKSKQNSLINLN